MSLLDRTMTQRYRTIVVDPPWPHDETNAAWVARDSGDLLPYATMTVAEIKALPVRSLAMTDVSGTTAREKGLPHDGSILYLWATTKFLWDANEVARAWGFTPTVVLVWCKPIRGFTLGGTFASNVEFVIVAKRNTPRAALSKAATRWFEWPRGSHSAKPDAFYDMVEQVSSGPYVELFARRARFGWDYWGDQSLGTARMEAVA